MTSYSLLQLRSVGNNELDSFLNMLRSIPHNRLDPDPCPVAIFGWVRHKAIAIGTHIPQHCLVEF